MTTSTTIEIDRYATIQLDEYELPVLVLVPEEGIHRDADADLVILEVECDCYGYYEPARLSGPPEDCYPEEYDFEISNVRVEGYPDFTARDLTETEERWIEERFFDDMNEAACDGPDYEPDYDDYDDYNYNVDADCGG